jgi:hypothetical protein
MLNPPLMVLMSYIDEINRADNNGSTHRLATRKPLEHYSLDLGPTTLLTTLDPAGPGYMAWRAPKPKPCTEGPVAFGTGAGDPIRQDLGYSFYLRLQKFIFGAAYGTGVYNPIPCYAPNGAEVDSQFSDEDWSTWHMVTVRPNAAAPDTSPTFWNILQMRTAPSC